jgi:hypothetical protein
MLPKKNRLEENLDAAKSMIKSFRLGYEKNDMCPTFCILYYSEYANFTE